MSNWQCVVCGAKLDHSKNLEFKTSVSGREIIITNLSGAKCPECDENITMPMHRIKSMKL